jgi:nuclear GTP-binding protein
VHVETLADVMTPVQAIVERCPAPYLMQLYCIPKFKEAAGFLTLVAKATGKLKRGGVPNLDAAGRGVLHDWNTGKIKYYCKPPKQSAKGSLAGSEIVSSFSDVLDVAAMSDVKVLDSLETDELCDYVGVDALAGRLDENDRDGDADKMEEQESEPTPTASKRTKVTVSGKVSKEEDEGAISEATHLRRKQRDSKKKEGKALRRSQPVAADQPYDFETDFAE